MIKFLKKFFNLGKTPLQVLIENPVEPNSINTSWQYKRLRRCSVENKIEDINNFLSLQFNYQPKFLNDFITQSIIDGDLILFKEIFLHQRRNRVESGLGSDNMLDYAQEAFKHNKANIFEYLIDYYHSKYSKASSYSVNNKFISLLELMIDSNQTKHFETLNKYKLTPFDGYIQAVIDYCSELSNQNIDDELRRINFIVDNFPKKINKDRLFYYACLGGGYNKPSKKIIEKFVNAGADIYYQKGEGLAEVGKAKSLEIVKYLLDESAIRSPESESPYSLKAKYNGYISNIASKCAQVDDNNDVIKCFLDHGAYLMRVEYHIDPERYSWVDKYKETKELFNELKDELKLSTEVKKSNKMKI